MTQTIRSTTTMNPSTARERPQEPRGPRAGLRRHRMARMTGTATNAMIVGSSDDHGDVPNQAERRRRT